MEFKSDYESKTPNKDGYVEYTAEEHHVWQALFTRQSKILPGRACDEHLKGLELLDLSPEAIPQLPNLNEKMRAITGWTVYPVAALISHRKFFQLLADRQFPAATFIRRMEELDYLKEPDIFHEIYGHCPMLTQPDFADFVQAYAEKVLTMEEEDWALMQRLFWFTVEFGLIQTADGLRAYGGGILSSIGETVYCVESDVPQRQFFNPLVVFRTPYRIDMMQPVYFVIESYRSLYDVITNNIEEVMAKARELGEFPPLFPIEEGNPSIQIRVC